MHSLLPITMFVVAFASAIVVLTIQLPRLLRVIKKTKKDNLIAAENVGCDNLPGISVVVYTHNSTSGLEKIIPQLMSQKYPEDKYEVIVVNDGANQSTESLLLLMESKWTGRLRHTFTPSGTRGISSKNLSLMLGVKSARFPVVLHTTSDVIIPTENWVFNMALPFCKNPNIQIVIGAAILSKGKRSRRRMYFMDTVNYLASALSGKPWRGDGSNLAYTRNIFFENNGFCSLHNLRHGGGDDDAYISQIATAGNTAVCLAKDSIVRISPEDAGAYWLNMLRRRAWAKKQCRPYARRLQIWSSGMLWLSLLASVIAVADNYKDWTIIVLVSALQLVLWITLMLFWGKVSKVMTMDRLMLKVPGALLSQLIRTIYHFRVG